MHKDNLSDCAVFFDFDNTITHFDVLDSIVEKFSVNKKWMAFEVAWKKGKIGSKGCLSGQLKSVRVDKARLDRYLARIKVDPYFKKIIALLKESQVKPVILSDSFSYFIKSILRNNGINGIKIYSNKIKLSGGKLVPHFPHQHENCRICGNCKTNHLPKSKFDDRVIIYIGDGLSDLCPSKNSDIVFAKGNLKKYLLREGKPFISFSSLKNVYDFMRRMDR
ncbi:MAG: MtnX-like HAD-IB family phosphatase [Candidatus Omnitrophota bacterium]|nr:MtnX-like HAD-IB family phosphatase [Candidatus Omnitrophota bacterium]